MRKENILYRHDLLLLLFQMFVYLDYVSIRHDLDLSLGLFRFILG